MMIPDINEYVIPRPDEDELEADTPVGMGTVLRQPARPELPDPYAPPEGWGTVLADKPTLGAQLVQQTPPPAYDPGGNLAEIDATLAELSKRTNYADMLRANAGEKKEMLDAITLARSTAEKNFKIAKGVRDKRIKAIDGEMKALQDRYDVLAKKTSREIREEGFGGTGTKIVNLIGMALGAVGASLGGHPNYAMELVQSKIDHAFKTHASRKNGIADLIGMKKQDYARAEQVLGGKLEAIKFFRDSAVLDATSKMEVMAKEESNQIQLDSTQATIAQTRANIAMARNAQAERILKKNEPKPMDPVASRKVSGVLGAIKVANEIFEDKMKLEKDWKPDISWPLIGGFWDSDARRFETAANRAATVFAEMINTGVVGEKDFPRYQRMMPTMNDSEVTAIAKHNDLIKMLRDDLQSIIDVAKANGQDTTEVQKLMDRLTRQVMGEPRKPGATAGAGQ